MAGLCARMCMFVRECVVKGGGDDDSKIKFAGIFIHGLTVYDLGMLFFSTFTNVTEMFLKCTHIAVYCSFY